MCNRVGNEEEPAGSIKTMNRLMIKAQEQVLIYLKAE
jgi:hypothetical protein